MAIEPDLDASVSLAEARRICPPRGWVESGFAADDPLRVLPRSRIHWHPPGNGEVLLYWSISTARLRADSMNFLISLLEAPPGPVSTRSLAELHPTLIRVPIDSIASAEVVQYAQTWPLLRVQYRLGEHDEAGIVHFCPTEFFKRGEFQLLGFEGNEPYYTLYLPVAQASMTTWHLGDE